MTIRRLSNPAPEQTDLPEWVTDLERRELMRFLSIISAINDLSSEDIPAILDELSAANAVWFTAGVTSAQTLKQVFNRPDDLELSPEQAQSEAALVSAMASTWVAGLLTGVQLALQKGLVLESPVSTHY